MLQRRQSDCWRTFLQLVYSILLVVINNGQISAITCAKYQPDWDSLDKRPLPKWYDESKIGVFIHWGVYSVPSMGSEWFWQNWKGLNKSDYITFMENNYKPNFAYQQFASDFTAELFNATQWALLLKDSGAKYVVMVSKHHDGYCLWPSKYSFGWNSFDVGPRRDLVGELETAVRNYTDMHFGLYYSYYEWFNPMWKNDKKSSFQENLFVRNKISNEQRDLVMQYRPEVYWSDGDWEASAEYWQSREFLAWLYNESPVRDTVVVNDRFGQGTYCKHGGFYNCQDRFNPGIIFTHKWENAMTLDKKSWGYRSDVTLEDIISNEQLIQQIVSTVSCYGNILINISPTSYGTIPTIFEERLRAMGNWLRINGEAIYGTSPWLQQNDSIQSNVWYTSRSIKRKALDGEMTTSTLLIYAIVLSYPYDTNSIELKPWLNQEDNIGLIREYRNENINLVGLKVYSNMEEYRIASVKMLGLSMKDNADIKWHFNEDKATLHIDFPPKHRIDGAGLQYAWTIQLEVLQ